MYINRIASPKWHTYTIMSNRIHYLNSNNIMVLYDDDDGEDARDDGDEHTMICPRRTKDDSHFPSIHEQKRNVWQNTQRHNKHNRNNAENCQPRILLKQALIMYAGRTNVPFHEIHSRVRENQLNASIVNKHNY